MISADAKIKMLQYLNCSETAMFCATTNNMCTDDIWSSLCLNFLTKNYDIKGWNGLFSKLCQNEIYTTRKFTHACSIFGSLRLEY